MAAANDTVPNCAMLTDEIPDELMLEIFKYIGEQSVITKTVEPSDVPEVAHSDVPEVAHSDIPEVAHSDVPEVAHSDIPEVAHSAVPEAAHSAVPEAAHSAVPEAAHSDVPEVAHSAVPEVAHSAVPEAAYSALPSVDDFVYLFCYGSNSPRQIAERLKYNDQQTATIQVIDAYLPNHVRIFAGTSTRWDGGGIASIVPATSEYIAKSRDPPNVYGIAVKLRESELPQLDAFERGYVREMREIVLQHSICNSSYERVNAFVYIKENHKFVRPPSEKYLMAIHEMIMQRKRKTTNVNPVIMIRRLKNEKITTIAEDGEKHYQWVLTNSITTVSSWCYSS
jgi:hypothetical protein